MKITVCIGSSCHIKGSKQIVEQLQHLISRNSLEDRVSITGAFCMGGCMNGVCVKIDETMFSLQQENVEPFFDTEVRSRLAANEKNNEENGETK